VSTCTAGSVCSAPLSPSPLRHELLLRSIELYGHEVIPRVGRPLAEARPARAESGKAAAGK